MLPRTGNFGPFDEAHSPGRTARRGGTALKGPSAGENERSGTLSPISTRVTPEALRSRILLAEDNVVNQRLTARVLEKSGHTVVIVANGREALDALRDDTFDMVLMDVQMPGMDGYEATRAIRTGERIKNKHIPVLAFTAHAMAGDRDRCLAAGMNGYISKPINASHLLNLVSRPNMLRSAPLGTSNNRVLRS